MSGHVWRSTFLDCTSPGLVFIRFVRTAPSLYLAIVLSLPILSMYMYAHCLFFNVIAESVSRARTSGKLGCESRTETCMWLGLWWTKNLDQPIRVT